MTTQGLIFVLKHKKRNVLLIIHIVLWGEKQKDTAQMSLHLMRLPSPGTVSFSKESPCESEACRRSYDVLDRKSELREGIMTSVCCPIEPNFTSACRHLGCYLHSSARLWSSPVPFFFIYDICTSKKACSSYFLASHTLPPSTTFKSGTKRPLMPLLLVKRYALTIICVFFCYILGFFVPLFAATLMEPSLLFAFLAFPWECTASEQSSTLISSVHVGSNRQPRSTPSILLDRQVRMVWEQRQRRAVLIYTNMENRQKKSLKLQYSSNGTISSKQSHTMLLPEDCRRLMILEIFSRNTPNRALELKLHLRTESLPVT